MKRKKTFCNYFLMLCSPMVLILACNQQVRDKELKADITTKAKEDINFAGVNFVVDQGVVTLTGHCPTEKARAMVRQKLSTIHVIDSVEDHLTIGPVVLGSSLITKQEVDSILAQYPGVTSLVSDTSVTIVGNITAQDREKMISSVKKVQSNIDVARLRIRM